MSVNGNPAQEADPQTSERPCNCGLPGPDYGPHEPDCLWWDRFGSPVSPLQEFPEQIPSYEDLYRFVERIACYDDYTHDEVDEVKILRDLQSGATKLWNPNWSPSPPEPAQSRG